MRVIVLAGIIAVLSSLSVSAGEKPVSLVLSNVQHAVQIPENWVSAQGKIEWRSGSRGEESLSLYFEPGKSLAESLANVKARFSRMFAPRNLTTSVIQDSGDAQANRWSYCFVSAQSDPKLPRTLYYQRYQSSGGKTFYLQYRKVLKMGEATDEAVKEGRRLTALWSLASK